MNKQRSEAFNPLIESKRSEKSWFDLLTRPAAPLTAAASLIFSDATQAAGASVAEVASTGVGYININLANTNVAGGGLIRRGSVTFINETTAITCAHVFDDDILLKAPRITVGTGTNFNTSSGSGHSVAVTNVTLFPGYVDRESRTSIPDLAVLKLDTPVAHWSPMRIAASRPAVRSFVFLEGYSQSDSANNKSTPSKASILTRKAVVTGAPRFGEASELYFNAEFNRDLHRDVVRDASRDLGGGGVFNEKGELVGIMSVSRSYSFAVSTTILDLTNPWVKAKIVEAAGGGPAGGGQ